MYCYVVKSPVFSLQRGNFQKNQEFSQKWKLEKILLIKNDGHIGFIYVRKMLGWLSWCIKDLWGTKVVYCYVVKWPVFSLQRGSVKWPIPPSNFSPLCIVLLDSCLSRRKSGYKGISDPVGFILWADNFVNMSRYDVTAVGSRRGGSQVGGNTQLP